MRTIPPEDRRKIRELAGVSRAVLADLLGVPWDRVKAYETKSTPAGEDAARYMDALDAMSAPYATAMDTEQRADLAARFDQYQRDYPIKVCDHCLGIHVRACPRVKRLAYDDNHRISEVEYWPDSAWPKSDVTFADGPEMMRDDGES